MSIIPGTTTTHSFWKLGDGNIFSGGSIGYDSITTRDSDGETLYQSSCRPAGAVDITEAEYEAIKAAIIADGEQVVADGDAWLAAQKADEDALLVSARAKLVAGTPLSAEEAAIITRGL